MTKLTALESSQLEKILSSSLTTIELRFKHHELFSDFLCDTMEPTSEDHEKEMDTVRETVKEMVEAMETLNDEILLLHKHFKGE